MVKYTADPKTKQEVIDSYIREYPDLSLCKIGIYFGASQDITRMRRRIVGLLGYLLRNKRLREYGDPAYWYHGLFVFKPKVYSDKLPDYLTGNRELIFDLVEDSKGNIVKAELSSPFGVSKRVGIATYTHDAEIQERGRRDLEFIKRLKVSPVMKK